MAPARQSRRTSHHQRTTRSARMPSHQTLDRPDRVDRLRARLDRAARHAAARVLVVERRRPGLHHPRPRARLVRVRGLQRRVEAGTRPGGTSASCAAPVAATARPHRGGTCSTGGGSRCRRGTSRSTTRRRRPPTCRPSPARRTARRAAARPDPPPHAGRPPRTEVPPHRHQPERGEEEQSRPLRARRQPQREPRDPAPRPPARAGADPVGPGALRQGTHLSRRASPGCGRGRRRVPRTRTARRS